MQNNPVYIEEFKDRLSQIVVSNDMVAARLYFDEAFHLSAKKAPKAAWDHLLLATLLDNKPMMKLLALWGAAPTADNLEDLERLAPEKYPDRLRLLRLCGVKIPPARPEFITRQYWVSDHPEYDSEMGEFKTRKVRREPRTGPLNDFIDGHFIDHRIAKLPAEARQILYKMQQKAPDAFIAGGGLSDAFNDKSIDRLDYYVTARGEKGFKNLCAAFQKAGIKVSASTSKESELEVEKERQGWFFMHRYKEKVKTRTVDISLAEQTPCSLTFIDIASYDKKAQPNMTGTVISRLSVKNDQICTDGRTVAMTPDCQNTIAYKSIDHHYAGDQTAERLQSLVKKYPDWKLGYYSKQLLER